jgi:hypothetical protein
VSVREWWLTFWFGAVCPKCGQRHSDRFSPAAYFCGLKESAEARRALQEIEDRNQPTRLIPAFSRGDTTEGE